MKKENLSGESGKMPETIKPELTKQDLKVIEQVLQNSPTQNLQVAGVLINLLQKVQRIEQLTK